MYCTPLYNAICMPDCFTYYEHLRLDLVDTMVFNATHDMLDVVGDAMHIPHAAQHA